MQKLEYINKKNLNLLGMYLRLKMHRTNIFLDNLEKKGIVI